MLRHISYTNQNDNPPASINLNWHIDDGETTDFGGAQHSDTLQTVNITAVNDAPVNTVPGPQTTNEDTALVFSTLGGTAISVSTVDANEAADQVTLGVTNGSPTQAPPTGLPFPAGSTGAATMTVTETLANSNTARDGLPSQPALN